MDRANQVKLWDELLLEFSKEKPDPLRIAVIAIKIAIEEANETNTRILPTGSSTTTITD